MKIPAWALASYYLRNYGFAFDGEGSHDLLIETFKKELLFDQDEDFDVLFDAEPPVTFTGVWFEPFAPSEGANDG